MADPNDKLVQGILHYQQSLEKYWKRHNEEKILYYIKKLGKLPITVKHLIDTGVGRTVNSMRKLDGEVAKAADNLVYKWKMLVQENKDESEEEEENDTDDSSEEEIHSSQISDSSRDRELDSVPVTHTDRKHREYQPKEIPPNEQLTSKSKSDKDQRRPHEKKIKEEHHHKTKEKTKSEKENKHHSDHGESSKSAKASSKEDEPPARKTEKKHSIKHNHHHKDDDESSVKEEKYKHKTEKASGSKAHKSSSNGGKKYGNDTSANDFDSDEGKTQPKVKKDRQEKVKSEKKRKNDDAEVGENEHKRTKRSTDEKAKRGKEEKTRKKTTKSSTICLGENGIDSGSGASFAEALGMLKPPSSSKALTRKSTPPVPAKIASPLVEMDSPPDSPEMIPKPLKTKALEPLDVDMSSLLPEITPNYRPLASALLDSGFSRNKIHNEDHTLSAVLTSRTQRTKVYSGNKILTAVPTLEDLCLRTIKDNVHAMEYTGGVPYNILKPVLDHLTATQLFDLEHYNPYLVEDTDELWCYHCQREFKAKQKQEMETWREMYLRCLDEREAKLRALTANIKQAQDKSLPVRQTKLAYVDSVVKPPRSVVKKQAKHGTAGASTDKRSTATPTSRLNALATAGAAGQTAVPNPGSRAASTSAAAQPKPKKAPLMQKTLAFFKNNRRFRR